MTKKAPTTAATQALDRLGVPYVPHPYEHDAFVEGYGLEAARELGAPPERVFKTLVVEADGRLTVAVVPVSAMLDLKSLAAVVGAKRAVMAPPDVAERKTGYVVGGISPLGQRTRLPLVLDATAQDFDTIYVSGGRRGFDIELTGADLLTATGGRLAAIGVPK
ncbi:Cys-tRNA(Pro) deacylase [Amnibacterium kyonggiense]|uniref:Cys-tRNA(Pro)/Cys-tRNA(Cys) deacylase n=1 Tax=Amnibacterium kyonggiense TaxID=595671 RepID=A0A4R7FQQ8_9MICO|nr:Cys-tRNA(Pro) deacylase [Amnibacterium kyonggiense]TDS80046.1 Cys-tRNA(Pro)/Cys-tRNA(Cys) deacylase [Amnibacterium kyonggiense]